VNWNLQPCWSVCPTHSPILQLHLQVRDIPVAFSQFQHQPAVLVRALVLDTKNGVTYSPGSQDVSWHQCLAFRHGLDQVGDRENQVICRRILTKFTINVRLNTQHLIQMRSRDCNWTLKPVSRQTFSTYKRGSWNQSIPSDKMYLATSRYKIVYDPSASPEPSYH
jgi:hypothetical protein